MKTFLVKHKTAIIISIALIAIIAWIRYAKKKAASADALNPISSGGGAPYTPFSAEPPEDILETEPDTRRTTTDSANRANVAEQEYSQGIATRNKRRNKLHQMS